MVYFGNQKTFAQCSFFVVLTEMGKMIMPLIQQVPHLLFQETPQHVKKNWAIGC